MGKQNNRTTSAFFRKSPSWDWQGAWPITTAKHSRARVHALHQRCHPRGAANGEHHPSERAPGGGSWHHPGRIPPAQGNKAPLVASGPQAHILNGGILTWTSDVFSCLSETLQWGETEIITNLILDIFLHVGSSEHYQINGNWCSEGERKFLRQARSGKGWIFSAVKFLIFLLRDVQAAILHQPLPWSPFLCHGRASDRIVTCQIYFWKILLHNPGAIEC